MAHIRFKHINAIFELDIDPNELLILLALSRYADEDGASIYPAIPRIAHDTGYSSKQVGRIIKKLRERGILHPVGKLKKGNIEYKIIMEKAPLKTPIQRYKKDRIEKIINDNFDFPDSSDDIPF